MVKRRSTVNKNRVLQGQLGDDKFIKKKNSFSRFWVWTIKNVAILWIENRLIEAYTYRHRLITRQVRNYYSTIDPPKFDEIPAIKQVNRLKTVK